MLRSGSSGASFSREGHHDMLGKKSGGLCDGHVDSQCVMPIRAWLKRRTAGATGSRPLAADAVQSATCAYLAALTLAGLAINTLWHIHWVDGAAALLALPILVLEGWRALRDESCGCC